MKEKEMKNTAKKNSFLEFSFLRRLEHISLKVTFTRFAERITGIAFFSLASENNSFPYTSFTDGKREKNFKHALSKSVA